MANGSIFEVASIDRIDSMLWMPFDEILIRYDSLINLDEGEKVQATQLR